MAGQLAGRGGWPGRWTLRLIRDHARAPALVTKEVSITEGAVTNVDLVAGAKPDPTSP